jgi:hypothetical protein
MHVISWAEAPHRLRGIRWGAGVPVHEVIREVGRAVAALAAVLAWGLLLLLLAA